MPLASLLKASIYGNYFLSWDYVSIIGILPEVFFLFQFLIEVVVDWVFWFTFDKRRSLIIHDLSSAGILMQP
jgi:hypothetical protein